MLSNLHKTILLTNWSPSKVKSMDNMFYSALKFNGNLSTWNVINVVSNKNYDYNAQA